MLLFCLHLFCLYTPQCNSFPKSSSRSFLFLFLWDEKDEVDGKRNETITNMKSWQQAFVKYILGPIYIYTHACKMSWMCEGAAWRWQQQSESLSTAHSNVTYIHPIYRKTSKTKLLKNINLFFKAVLKNKNCFVF